ncbi:hypothetical protein Tco_0832650 [Tanacetum coccineum]
MEQMTSICDMVGQIMQKKEEEKRIAEKRIAEEQPVKDRYWKIPICYNDDEEYTIAITPDLPTKESEYFLIMGDEHLSTIPEKESDELIKSSFDYLLEEFSGELAHIDPIPPGIEKADFDLEEEIRLVENFLYDNSSPRPPVELNLEIADTILESLSQFPILVEDNDSHMEEIDLFLATNDSMPPDIEDDDYDSEGDICFLEELFNNDSLPLPKNESFSLDHFDDPSLPRPPPPPANRSDFHEEFTDELAQIISQPEYDRFCFKIEPELGNLTMDVVGNIFQESEPRVHVLNVLPTLELDFIPSSESIFAYVVWIFLPFLFIPVIPPYLLSCGDEDTIFDPGISKDCPDCEDSQFCHSSRVSHPQLQLGIRYPNLID